MYIKKFILKLSIFLLIASSAEALDIGVTAGPHAIIMEEVKKELAKQDIKLNIVIFDDFILPNMSLASGEIDANSYQHIPFLEEQIKTRGYNFTSVSKTIILPLAIYSQKYSVLSDIPIGSKLAIPSDPTNSARALLLLKKAGIIDLKTTDNPTVLDVIDNTKKLKIIELAAPQIPHIMQDIDLAIVNTDWILLTGVKVNTLFSEGKDSPYVNIIVVRKGKENNKEIQELIKVYHSESIKNFIQEQFKGGIIPAW